MLRSVSLVDFQSHENTDIEFGPFTVIVGSSSSGKSALVRAIKLLAENARGVSYVRQGAKTCRVTAVSESHTISIERGKSVSAYNLSHSDSCREMSFTKCATGVPDPVTAALGLGDAKLWLAGQFDRPFLLDETGAEVARVLGKLTNVTMIYAAVREVNRRSVEAKRSWTSVDQELAEVVESVSQYSDLPVRVAAGHMAEESLDRAEVVAHRRAALVSSVAELKGVEGRVRSARDSLCVVPSVERLKGLSALRERLIVSLTGLAETHQRCTVDLKPLPDPERLGSLMSIHGKLRESLKTLSDSSNLKNKLQDQLKDISGRAAQAKVQFSEALQNAGKCPLCGASAAHAQIDSVL